MSPCSARPRQHDGRAGRTRPSTRIRQLCRSSSRPPQRRETCARLERPLASKLIFGTVNSLIEGTNPERASPSPTLPCGRRRHFRRTSQGLIPAVLPNLTTRRYRAIVITDRTYAGRWYAAPDAGTPLPSAVDAIGGGQISATGVDLAEMVTYARETLALTLMAGKAEFYALSTATGATTRDSGVDIDGGFGTLLSYASKARATRSDSTVFLDGNVESLGKGGTPRATHLYVTPRRRRTDQRLQFPVWGSWRSWHRSSRVCRPSSNLPVPRHIHRTRLPAHHRIRLAPGGSVQLLSGSARGLLDHLGGAGLSGIHRIRRHRAATLRAHPNVVGKGVHFNAEADSLNASILGEDAVPGTPEFDLYVKQLVTEMTVKAGQKCTAIRRALVPVSAGRRRCRCRIRATEQSGRGDIRCRRRHDGTVIGYDGIDHADRTRGPWRGKPRRLGGHCRHRHRTSTGAGPRSFHGRVLVLNRDDAKESTGHGSPFQSSYTARTAVQGHTRRLTAVGERWFTGSARNDRIRNIHSGKSLAELKIGDTVVGGPRQVALADIDHFAEFTGDTFYAHDPVRLQRRTRCLFVDPAPGPVLANFGVDSLRFLTPVKAEDSLTVTLTAKTITPRSSADYGEVRWDAVVTNQDNDPVATYDVLTLVAKTRSRRELKAHDLSSSSMLRTPHRSGGFRQVLQRDPRPARQRSARTLDFTFSSSARRLTAPIQPLRRRQPGVSRSRTMQSGLKSPEIGAAGKRCRKLATGIVDMYVQEVVSVL
ncbi:unnamed protein product, partial [Mesorhabditis spiculigera]